MRVLVCLIAIAAATSAADPKTRKKEPVKASRGKAPAAKAHSAPVVTLPAGAVEQEPGTWKHSDAAGRNWIYRQTPFGLARFEDRPTPAPDAVDAARKAALEDVTAVEDGDFIRFERPGPFGRYKWQSPKSELTEMEQNVWDRARAKAVAKANQEPPQ